MTIRILHPLFSLLASVTRQEQARQVAYLKAENELLRARLPKQILITPKERQRLLRAGRRLGLKLKGLISIVSYPTFQRWVREAEGRRSRKLADAAADPSERRPGRPKTAEDIQTLVIRIRQETNYGYGSTGSGNPLITDYKNPDRLGTAIPHSERLTELPRAPFIGELSYRGGDRPVESATPVVQCSVTDIDRRPERVSRLQTRPTQGRQRSWPRLSRKLVLVKLSNDEIAGQEGHCFFGKARRIESSA